jgi:hypothetical protein
MKEVALGEEVRENDSGTWCKARVIAAHLIFYNGLCLTSNFNFSPLAIKNNLSTETFLRWSLLIFLMYTYTCVCSQNIFFNMEFYL